MTNNGSNPYVPDFGSQGFQMSSGISFTKEELDAGAGKISPEVDRVDALERQTGGLGVPWPHFGVIGMGIQSVHGDAINQQKEALARARRALETWMPALTAADRNYQQADDDSGDGLDDLGGTGDLGGMGNLGGAGDLGGLKPDLPTGAGELPDMPDTDLPGPPDGTLPDGTLPDGTLPDGTLPDGTLPDGTPPGGELPGAGNLPGTDLPQQNLPTTDPADMKVPDIDSALNPAKTDLSSYQPTTPQLPGNLPSGDPSGLGTRTGPGSIGGTGAGLGAGLGPNAGIQGVGAGLRGAGTPGMPMMPMMPMGGAGGAGDQERDRDKTVGLSEDEGVWGGDEDIAPQVIGQEDL
ncbi:hypothetical protein [Nonomuraea sp. NPDC049709]|uniref:hypothetical protein n=1 Tax=Nonomuraea sp. NPDC049709 TaxID=3154736 RepID=UPI003434C46E